VVYILLFKDLRSYVTVHGKMPLEIHFIYRGADKSLAQPTSECILFDGKHISFDATFVTYMNSTNIPQL
jgi:hypothetical protein